MFDVRTMLRERRKAAGLTTRDLGAVLDVTSTTVSRWERGEREPSFGDLHRWGRALGVEVDLVAREPREGGEVELTAAQDAALRDLARLIADIADDDAATLVLLARSLAGRR